MHGTIKVVIHGITGRVGRELAKAVCAEDDLEAVGAVSKRSQPGLYTLPDGSHVPLSNSLRDVTDSANVVVDFTRAEGALAAMRTAAPLKVNVVTGSTGLTEADLEEAADLSRKHQVGIVVAPNFAIGAVLMIHLARIAGRYFDHADLREVHHEAKIDAPSGTALAISRAVVEGNGSAYVTPFSEHGALPGTKGGVSQGVSMHSGRMPGRMAHHELVFGAPGQTVAIKHDSITRESFMPGVLMAIREVVKSPGLTVGLENIMGL